MKKKMAITFCLCFSGMFLLEPTNVVAQNAQLKYSIMMNGIGVGLMTLQKTCYPDKIQLSLESKAKKHFIISFEIHETHTEVFQNNIMTTASIFRRVNGKIKINMQMSFNGTNCQIESEGKASSISVKPVSWSLINLYFTEPVKVAEAFSDSFQQMLKVEDMGNHIYKVALPDGNSTYFYYVNGVCTKQVINHIFTRQNLCLQGIRCHSFINNSDDNFNPRNEP
ncbi:MAG TPA: DUF6134 family protein [Chitinophagaceae bacterium]|jgi:hypothetical protein